MTSVSPESFCRALAAIGEAIESHRDPAERATGIAAALRELWPGADVRVVLGNDGPAGRALPGTEPIVWRGRELGQIAVPDGASKEMLAAITQMIAVHLAADEFHADLLADAPRADVGELTGPLIHDVTNLLNNLLLNLAVLEQGGDLSMLNVPRLRTRSEQVAALIKEVQDYRRCKAPAGPPADVNAAAREAVDLLNHDYAESIGGECAVELELGADLPRVAAPRLDLVRCLTFLLKGAARASQSAGRPPRLITTAAATGVVVRVDLPGVQVLVESPSRLFDTLGAVCTGFSSLEVATCKSIARRFNGRFTADCPPDVGLVLQLELPSSPLAAQRFS